MNQKEIPRISLLLGSCDRYEDTWMPFFYQLRNHWKSFTMPVFLATESKKFHYAPLDIICPFGSEDNVKIWSKRILKTLDYIQSEFVLFMLDDFWLTSDVDIDVFNRLVDIIAMDKEIGYINLYADKTDNGKWLNPDGPTRGIKESEYSLCWETTSECPYRISTSAGLWRKSFLQKILRSHENAWQFEGRANWRVNKYYGKIKILETKKRVLNYPNGGFIWAGKCKEQYINLYPKSIINECVVKRGIYDESVKYSIPTSSKKIKHYIDRLRSYLPFDFPYHLR